MSGRSERKRYPIGRRAGSGHITPPEARPARITLKVLVIGAVAFVVLGIGGAAALHVRRGVIAGRGLTDGRAALEQEDWRAACKHLRVYLSRHPNDIEVLKEYARAQLLVRPLELENVGAAIGAYRRVLRQNPRDESAFGQLATLYSGLGNFGEVVYIARNRLEQLPDDAKAPVWMAKGLLSQNKSEEARGTLLTLIEKLEQRPERRPEYVEACRLIGTLDAQSESNRTKTEALNWFRRAVEYDSESPEALVNRARFCRASLAAHGQERETVLAAARADLERADALDPDDPRVRLLLSEEWMAHGELDRAAAELKALEDVDRERLRRYFPDPDDWVMSRFLVAAKLSLRKAETTKGVALADEVLASLKFRQQRIVLLPSAIELYLAGKKVDEARRCLDEYVDILPLTASIPGSNESIPYLRAIVARAEGRPYRVIEFMEPVTQRKRSRPIFWKLLAEAYSQTEQTRRSIWALKQGLRLEPLDRQMTMRLARQYTKQRDWNRALEAARLAESLDPTDIAVRLMRIEANISVAAGQPNLTTKPHLEALMKELASLRKSHPERVEVRILQAVFAFDRGRVDEAERELKLAIEECSETMGAELQLARVYFSSGRPAEAVDVLRTACQRHAAVAVPWEALSRLQGAQRLYEEARATLQAGIEAVSNRWEKHDLTLKLAMLEILHLDRQSGIDRLEDLVDKDADELRARSLLLGLAEIRRDVAEAQKLVDEIREIQGESGLLWRFHQASLWFSGSDWRAKQKDIGDALKRCVDADPGWSAPVLFLGRLHERLGNLGRAEGIYRRGLSVDPAAVDVANHLVGLLEKQKRFLEIKEVLDRVDASPQVLSGRRVRAAIGAGDLAKAIDELKLRIANDAKDANSRILLARLLYQQTRDPSLAFKYLDEAEATSPESMAITAVRVSILKAEKRLAEARRLLDAEVSCKGSFEAHFLRACFLADIGESELAEKAFRRLPSLSKGGQGHEVLGRFYADSNRLDDAIAAWDKGASIHPKSLSLKRRLMRALLRRGRQTDRERAVQLLSHLERLLPDDPDLLGTRASLLLSSRTEESVNKAQKLLQRVVQLKPTAVQAHLGLIGIAMEQRDYVAARDLAIRAQGANPKNTGLLLARGKAERALRNPGMARELASTILAEQPDNADACELLARVALDSRDPKALREALASLGEAIKERPESDRLQTMNAMLLNALGKTDQGIASLQAYTRTEHGKRSSRALLALADLYRVQGNLAECGKRIEEAAALAPDSPAVMRARIVWLGTQKKFDEIRALVPTYREEMPKDTRFLITAASVLAASGSNPHVQEAMALFEQAIAIAPPSIEARLGLAVLEYQTGNVDRAEQIYRKVLELDPDNPQALNDLAWILAEARNDYKAALKLADKGVRIAPENRNLRDTRGVILSNLPGRLKEARTDFEKCVALTSPTSRGRAKALFRLGGVCARLKDFRQAKRHLDEALRIDRAKAMFTPEERSEIDEILHALPQTKTHRSG